MYKYASKLTNKKIKLNKKQTISILIKIRTYCYNTP